MSTTPHLLANGSFTQNWSDTGLITTNDNWSGVPSIVGYLGDIDPGDPANVDAQTRVQESSGAVDVNANQTNPNTFGTGGVAEFQITNPVVAFQGSGTADAPSLVFYLDLQGLLTSTSRTIYAILMELMLMLFSKLPYNIGLVQLVFS